MKIQFQPYNKHVEFFDMPKPAVQYLPDWYKDMPTYLDNEKTKGFAKNTNAVSNFTLKGCAPFLDAMSAGYMAVLPFDIELRFDENKMASIRWAPDIDFINGHTPDQAPGLPAPIDGSGSILKWNLGWKVITPKGYSTLFTHPINRNDLPFRTLSGIVDTDTYPLDVQMPFQMLNSFNKPIHILEKGMPIFQMIPIKRDEWKSFSIPYDERDRLNSMYQLKSKITRSYKSQFWKRKKYL